MKQKTFFDNFSGCNQEMLSLEVFLPKNNLAILSIHKNYLFKPSLRKNILDLTIILSIRRL